MTEWNDEDHDLLDDLIHRLEDAWRTAAEGLFTAPAWSPDGSKLAFDRLAVVGGGTRLIETKEFEKLRAAK